MTGEHSEGEEEEDPEEEEEEEERGERRLADTRAALKQELAAAVNKIFELREIIRSLEPQLESKDRLVKVRRAPAGGQR